MNTRIYCTRAVLPLQLAVIGVDPTSRAQTVFPTVLPKMLHLKWKMANSIFWPLCEVVCCVAGSGFECGWNSSKGVLYW